ncbi:MAG TPA: hypothetical protein VKB71_10440 [Rhizomicrobium sp.]|nr:hypothetical protein [Rhizomicrobium sp.]
MPREAMHDFDFFLGSWTVHHRQLAARLKGSTEWIEFAGTCVTQATLGGQGNMDDNVLDKPGGAYRAVTLRAFDPGSETWSIWWLDARTPGKLDVPMVGCFEDGIGTFLADDQFEGKAIKVRFLWSRITPSSCRWEQAFSEDAGRNWETNWVMDFTRR